MNDVESFIKVATELQLTHENEIVKVASILERIKKLWQSITNPQYRDSVSALQMDNKQAQEQIDAINKSLAALSKALKTGDLEAYSKILEQIKNQTGQFLDELRETDRKAKEIFSWTVEEMNHPGFLNRVTKKLPQHYDLEFGKNYKNVPLRQFAWYKNVNPTVFINDKGDNNAFLMFVRRLQSVLPSEISPALQNDESILNNFQAAIMAGTIISARPLTPRGEEKAQAGQSEIDVLTAPFDIPSIGASVQATVTLRDLRTSLDDPKRLSLRRTKSVRVVQPPKASVAHKLAQAQVVPYHVTHLNDLEFAEVMRQGYQKAFGTDPTAEALAGGWAQAALESGRPIKLPNNNVGNIKASNNWIKSGKPFFVKDTIDFTSEGKKYKNLAKWRAYATPIDGAAAYWQLLGNNYTQALRWYKAGDPESASVVLGLNGYYTAPITGYSSGVTQLYQQFMKNIAPKLSGLKSEPAPPPGEKPPVKKWVSDYSSEEKTSALASALPATTETQPDNDEIDNLIQKLVASQENTMMKNSLPENDILIMLKSSAPYSIQLEYARVTASCLRSVIDAMADVCSDGTGIEIQGSVIGNADTVSNAALAIAKLVSRSLEIKTGHVIRPIVVEGLLSKYARLNAESLLSNYRKFNFQRMNKNG